MQQVPDDAAYAEPDAGGDTTDGAIDGSGDPSDVGMRQGPDSESTGVESVDRVLAEVAAAADRPIGEHVQVFERAHEQLRRALDQQPSGDEQGS